MASMTRLRRPLREELARRRRENQGKPRAKAEAKKSKSVFSKCGPNGEMREHPNIDGLQWLAFFGEALRRNGACFASKVSAKTWQRDGAVQLSLQRRVPSPLPGVLPDQGGVWESWSIPTGIVNNHDIRAALKVVMDEKTAGLVFASSPHLRAINGL